MKLIITLLATSIITNTYAQATLKDVGLIGLLSHDMFAWDHKKEINKENGRLDLSTIFDYENGTRWQKGGDPKNSENSPVWSMTKRLINYYEGRLLINANLEDKHRVSRLETVELFHEEIIKSFERLSGLPFPKIASSKPATNIEQGALRAMHDILPGRINLIRSQWNPIKTISLTNPIFSKLYLNNEEFEQEIGTFDGDYDQEYKEIKIPFTGVTLNLKEIDGKFIEKFTPYKQEDMLKQLRLVGQKKIALEDVSFIQHVIDLFKKGMCSKENQWMNNDINIPCE